MHWDVDVHHRFVSQQIGSLSKAREDQIKALIVVRPRAFWLVEAIKKVRGSIKNSLYNLEEIEFLRRWIYCHVRTKRAKIWFADCTSCTTWSTWKTYLLETGAVDKKYLWILTRRRIWDQAQHGHTAYTTQLGKGRIHPPALCANNTSYSKMTGWYGPDVIRWQFLLALELVAYKHQTNFAN